MKGSNTFSKAGATTMGFNKSTQGMANATQRSASSVNVVDEEKKKINELMVSHWKSNYNAVVEESTS